MNILVFEYATSLGLKDPALTAEGQAMLKHHQRFKNILIPFFNLKKFVPVESGSCNPIVI